MQSPKSDTSEEGSVGSASFSLFAGYVKIIRDSQINKQYQEYRSHSLSNFDITLFTIFMSVVVYPQLFLQVDSRMSTIACKMKMIEIILATLGFILIWMHCGGCLVKKTLEKHSETTRSSSILITTTALAFHLYRRSRKGMTLIDDFLPIYQVSYPNIYDEIDVMAMDNVLWLILVPIAQAMITKEYRLSVLLCLYLICLISLCISAPTYYDYNLHAIPVIVAYGLFGGLILLDYIKHHLTMFFLHRQLLTAMLTQERSAEEIRLHEMRHMIANVAHDLKSPLSSFMSGIEVIYEDLKGIEQNAFDSNDQKTLEFVKSIEGTTKYIQNINNFMLMTINRCLDCTKACNGLRLIPKYETLDLMETLSLPVECMSNTQQKITIHLLPWNEKQICSHIITDKQWLQENILCLLSNAVKYSSEGTVTISIALKSKRFFPDEKEKEKSDAILDADVPESMISPPTEVVREKSMLRKKQKPSIIVAMILKCFSFFTFTKYKVLPLGTNSSIKSVGGVQSIHSLDNVFPKSHQNKKKTKKNNKRGPTYSSIHSLYNMISTFELQQNDYSDFLLFSIEDTGIGMSDEARQSLFNPFKQNQRLAGGTGLGLYSLSKRLDALKGYYGVEKRKDGKQGSLFWFAIPYKPDQEMSKMCLLDKRHDNSSEESMHHVTKPLETVSKSPIKEAASKEDETTDRHFHRFNYRRIKQNHDNNDANSVSITATERLNFNAPRQYSSPPVSKERRFKFLAEDDRQSSGLSSVGGEKRQYGILIADDTVSVTKMMKMLLERHGHEVKVVDNGASALSQVQKQIQLLMNGSPSPEERFDLVLMDLQMPVMDGLEATKRIRSYEKEIQEKYGFYYHQAIICVSANSDAETMEEATEAGIDAFIPKPFTYETFRTTVDHLFDQLLTLKPN